MIEIRFTLDPEQFLHSGRTNVDDVIDITDLFQISRRKDTISGDRCVEETILLSKQLSSLFERDTASSEIQVRLVFVLIVETWFRSFVRRRRLLILGWNSFTAIFQFIEFQSEEKRSSL